MQTVCCGYAHPLPRQTVILQRLNMDNSWCVDMSGTRLVLDPWLEGVEVDYFRWFNTQWHQTPPVACGDVSAFDGVVITQKYADHFHEQTLRQLKPGCVLAPESLKARLQAVFPNADRSLFGASHRSHTVGAITVTQLPTRRRMDPIYDAYVFDDGCECLLVANHGFVLDDDHRAQLGSDWSCDVLLSPFNTYTLPRVLGGTVTPGLVGLQRLMGQVNPRAVIQTHDEAKHARGLVPTLARIEVFDADTVEDHAWLSERFVSLNDYTPVTV